MIRDPSDGSVREKATGGEVQKAPSISQKPPVDSGLPFASTKPEQQARLEKSREWLKQYRKAADDVNRMNDKGEVPDDAT